MKPIQSLDRKIALSRAILSLVAIISVYVDPTVPNLTPWFALTGGFFAIDRYALAILCLHFSYAAALYLAALRGFVWPSVATAAKMLDVAFAVVVAVFTEGATSPAYVFFTFAILAVGCREGFRDTAVVTGWSVGTYLVLILVSSAGESWTYVMRPVYLAITGSLIGFLGQQRIDFESRIADLETTAVRHAIARSLHDGYVQALAGVILRLESSRELIRRNESARAFEELTGLQTGVAREYDGVRRYVRSLVDESPPAVGQAPSSAKQTPISVHADFRAPGPIVEELLQILLEGTRNVMRHAAASSASLTAVTTNGRIRLTIDDDGVGFEDDARAPWSITSRVSDLGGDVRLSSGPGDGAHVEVEIPLERSS